MPRFSSALQNVPKDGRLNVSLLKDNSFLEMIWDETSLFKETNSKQDSTVSIWWDTLKAYGRGRMISYASFSKR